MDMAWWDTQGNSPCDATVTPRMQIPAAIIEDCRNEQTAHVTATQSRQLASSHCWCARGLSVVLAHPLSSRDGALTGRS